MHVLRPRLNLAGSSAGCLRAAIAVSAASLRALVLPAALLLACADDGSASGGDGGTTGTMTTTTTSASTTTAADATGADTTGFVPDGDPCPGPPACTTVADCCVGVPAGVACPGAYPTNWSCTGGVCQLGQCTTDTQCSDLFTGFACITVGGKKRCVAECGNDSGCEVLRNMPGTVCVDSDDFGRRYCTQPT